MKTVPVLVVLALSLSAGLALAEDDPKPPFPEGKSVQRFADLTYHIEVPVEYDPKKEYSLIVGLHGAGASAGEFATWIEALIEKDFIVVCPKSKGPAWNKRDIERVKKIVAHVMEKITIGKGRLHGVGFSNGGQHLGFLVFDKKLPFVTGCWMGSGFGGGKMPARAKKEMAALALAGEKDYALGACKGTVKRLRGKVRSVEFRMQPELEHDIPRDLMPYYHYWLTVMEGRFTPGEDESFDWRYDMKPGREIMAEEKRGGFVFFYSTDDEKSEDARHAEHVVLFDPRVRFFGEQAQPVMLDRSLDKELFASLGLTKTPAIVVMKPDGTVVKTFEGRIEAKDVAKSLRSVAKAKSMPK
jgi:hypothetical protein